VVTAILCNGLATLIMMPMGAALNTQPPSGANKKGVTLARQPIGRINSLDRSKIDKTPDGQFYSRPNLVTHTDDAFIKKLANLYDDLIPEGGVVLDMMSSHVSHLPESKSLARLDVHGMNQKELELNPARAATNGVAFVRDFNENPSFLGLCNSDEYDAVLCCVGVQYLEEAEVVFADLQRILKPGGICVVSFTNRFFFEKALSSWVERGMAERARLVTDYFRAAGGFNKIDIMGDGTGVFTQLLSAGGIGGDPFVAVVAMKEKNAI